MTTTVMSATEAEASPGGGLPVYNVKADFAGTPVSAGASRTDNTTAINNAAAAASAGGGGIVYLSEGDWGVATSPGVVMRSNVYFMLAAGCRVFQDFQDFDRGLFRCGDASNVGSVNQALSADATTGATSLTVSPVATVDPGFYILGSTKDVTAYAIQPVLAGEYVEVVSAQGGTLTLRSGVRDNYSTTDNASLRGPITFVENFGFFGPGEIINATPGGVPNPPFGVTGKARLIEVNFGRNFSIDGLVTRFQDRAAVSLLHCRDSRITGYKSYDGANDESKNLFGYALVIEGCSENVLVDDCHFARVRDGITTGDGATAPSVNPCHVGLPRNVLITNCTHHQPKLAGFGTHAAGDGIVYQSCKVSGYYDSGDPGQGGFVIQGARTDIIDCEVTDYVGNGIHLVAANGSKIRGARIRHITRKAAGTHGTGIFIAASGVLVEDVEIDTVDSNGIVFSPSGNGPPAAVTVDRVRIKNANGAADASGNGFHGILLNVAGAADIAISDVYVENTGASFRGYRAGAATDGVRILNASLAGPVHVDRVRTKGVAGQAVNDVGTRPAGSRRNNNYKLDDPTSLYVAADQVAFTPGNGITATNVQDALSQASAVSSSPASGHYGDGSDGPKTISGTYTLQRDMFWDTLVVPAGTTVITNGFRILARTSVTIAASAVVANNGGAASAPVGANGGTGGAGAPAGSLGGGGPGGAGGKSGVSGTAGAAGTATSPSLGGNGGSSGGGAGGVATPPSASRGSVRRSPLSIDGRVGGVGGSEFLQGGAGGRGANGGVSVPGGGGGGGGGVVVIATPALQLDGEIQATGGAGGPVSNGNGGGGGGGGTILLTYRTRTGTGTTKVQGGAGSTGGGSGGSAGTVIQVVD